MNKRLEELKSRVDLTFQQFVLEYGLGNSRFDEKFIIRVSSVKSRNDEAAIFSKLLKCKWFSDKLSENSRAFVVLGKRYNEYREHHLTISNDNLDRIYEVFVENR